MSVPTPHRLTVLDHSTVEARERVFVTGIQGPVRFVRCSCGWSAHSDDVNVYAAAEDHFGHPIH